MEASQNWNLSAPESCSGGFAQARGEGKPSLQTRDPSEAKQRFAKALAELEARWANLRAGPKLLTEREAHQLAAVA